MKKKFLVITLAVLTTCIGCHTSNLFKNEESKAYFKKAQQLQSDGKLDSALVYYNKADSSAPNTPTILEERGLLKSNLKLYSQAIEDLSKSIELTTDPEQKKIFLWNRALTYLEMGEKEKACADFNAVGTKNSKEEMEKHCK